MVYTPCTLHTHLPLRVNFNLLRQLLVRHLGVEVLKLAAATLSCAFAPICLK